MGIDSQDPEGRIAATRESGQVKARACGQGPDHIGEARDRFFQIGTGVPDKGAGRAAGLRNVAVEVKLERASALGPEKVIRIETGVRVSQPDDRVAELRTQELPRSVGVAFEIVYQEIRGEQVAWKVQSPRPHCPQHAPCGRNARDRAVEHRDVTSQN